MADTAIAITAGSGTNVDTRTEGTNGNHRQVIVLGDPATNAGVAPVDATAGVAVHVVPFATSGSSRYHMVAANGTNAQNIKNAAGKLLRVSVSNDCAYRVWAKFHDTAGAPTPGAGVVLSVSAQAGLDRDRTFEGLAFTTGLAVTITKLKADNDTTAVVAGDCVLDVEFI